jgi:GDPmannose 4,6-dehydratase
MKKALITGITGQDGSYLTEILLDKGYQVYGLTRKDSWQRDHASFHLKSNIEPIFGEAYDKTLILDLLKTIAFDEIYALASQSRPSLSWQKSSETILANTNSVAVMLQSILEVECDARLYHASSSEIFGDATSSPQDEKTPLCPTNPYALSKASAHQIACMYRDRFDLFVSNGILFNHESERRPLDYLTQKVTFGAACAYLGITVSKALNEAGKPIVNNGVLSLGNLDVEKDWGYAPDYARAMWQILQHVKPDDFVIGTGILHSIGDMCRIAYDYVGKNWEDHVVSDPLFMRQRESKKVVANPVKAREELGWQPTVKFADMLAKMTETHVRNLKHSNA